MKLFLRINFLLFLSFCNNLLIAKNNELYRLDSSTYLRLEQQPGFSIENFTAYRSALYLRRGAELKDERILLKSDGNEASYVRWEEYGFSLDKGFETVISYTSQTKDTKEFRFEFFPFSTDIPLSTVDAPSNGINFKQTSPNVISVEWGFTPGIIKGNLFDGKQHKIKLRYEIDSKSQDRHAILYVYIDDLSRLAGKVDFETVNFLPPSSEVLYGKFFPSISVFSRYKERSLLIHSWSFKSLNSTLPDIQLSSINKFVGFINIVNKGGSINEISQSIRNFQWENPNSNDNNWKRFKIRFDKSLIVDLKSNNLTKANSFITTDNIHMPEAPSLASYDITIQDPARVGQRFSTYTSRSIKGTGSTKMRDVTRYDGAIGKEISFDNIQMSVAEEFEGGHISGKFYVWGPPPENFLNVTSPIVSRYFLTFISKEPSEFHPIDSPTSVNRFGHIFVQWIALENNQTKVEAYGYYKTPGISKGGEIPSKLRDELLNDDYWQKGTGTFRVEISQKDYENTIKVRKRWFNSSSNYNYVMHNCVDFAFSVATGAKLSIGNVPTSIKLITTPYAFVKQLYMLNKSKQVDIDAMYSR